MTFQEQKILPAVRNMKDLETLVKSDYKYIVLLDSHIGRLNGIVKYARSVGKKVFLHADLVHGLKSDEYAAEFLCQEVKPDGLISTRTSVIQTAKKKGIIGIQRLFLLDSIALETSYKMIEKANPDFIEVLPGIMPNIITEIKEKTKIPIFAGGLIRTMDDVNLALGAGATAVTTSRKELWENFA